jgi:hypothetical protein
MTQVQKSIYTIPSKEKLMNDHLQKVSGHNIKIDDFS